MLQIDNIEDKIDDLDLEELDALSNSFPQYVQDRAEEILKMFVKILGEICEQELFRKMNAS